MNRHVILIFEVYILKISLFVFPRMIKNLLDCKL